MEPKKPLAHETRLPHDHEPVDLPLLPRSAERDVLFNDGDCLVLAIPNGDEFDFRAVVRVDPDDTENLPTPLSREEFLAKYPLHPSFIDPNASPLTRARCQQLASTYHAHEKEYLALSSVQRLMILDPPPGDSTRYRGNAAWWQRAHDHPHSYRF